MDFVSPQIEIRRSESRPLAEATRGKFELGLALMDAGKAADALVLFEQAASEAPGHARIRSFLGLAVARLRATSVELFRSANPRRNKSSSIRNSS